MCMPKYDNNEVCRILVLSVTCRKKSSTQICITYLNLEKTHIYYVVCLMLFVDDDECLKTPPVVTSTQTARTRLALTFVLVKGVLRVTVKLVKVKLKRNMEPYGKHHMLLIGAKTFILRCTILIPLISNGYLFTNKKRFPYFLFWG